MASAPLLCVRPRAVRAGDRIALVAPASPLGSDHVEAGAAELRRLGFEPVVHVSGEPCSGYVAGPAAERAAQFTAALRTDRIAAILAVRGGFGSAELLPYLSTDLVRRAGKLLIGYSDITALLTFFTLHAGVVSVHGPMVDRRLAAGSEAYDDEGFLRLIGDASPFGDVDMTGVRALQAGLVSGPLVGGTLTQLVSLLGTPHAFTPPPGAILFIDEVNERPYRLDRMLLHLRQAGALSEVRGIVFNELPGCAEPGGGPDAEYAVRRALAGLAGPIVMGLPSGHTTQRMLSLPFGVPATLRASGQDGVQLTIDGAAVQ